MRLPIVRRGAVPRTARMCLCPWIASIWQSSSSAEPVVGFATGTAFSVQLISRMLGRLLTTMSVLVSSIVSPGSASRRPMT